MVFFVALLAVYNRARSIEQRATVLLVGSILFYASWEPIYLLLLGCSLAINHRIYLHILNTRSRLWLITGIIINLAVLGIFKYIGLIYETGSWIGSLFDETVTVVRPEWAGWVLPLGISFFTFQMLSALIDAYRGEWKRAVNFREWCLYVTFFPQLIAGPIVRAHQLFDQLENLKPLSVANLRIGAIIFVGGLIKKSILADNIAPVIDRLYAHPEQLDFFLSWFATTGFGMQIYLDFSGYSEMALGLALMLGVTLPRNFRYPYISRNFSEFWTRWHITLSKWLRDYLYIPLGGSRCKLPRTYFNLMVTMLLGGLWHGAGWTFVFWGFLHGSYLVIYHALSKFYQRHGLASEHGIGRFLSLAGWPVTFFLTSFTWVFFRAESFDHAWSISTSMMGLGKAVETLANLRLYELALVIITFFLVLIEPFIIGLFEKKGTEWWWHRIPFPVRGLTYAGIALFVIILGGQTQKFIYFDF
jgi:D-alanyl-lipoteichoic acid acyltransferase DltB (MBOAT superfamily)